MSLFVDVQAVPNKIFEAVKGRILANRAKLQKSQQDNRDVKGMTRPRVQRTRFGASVMEYRRPEPAGTGDPSCFYFGPLYPGRTIVVPQPSVTLDFQYFLFDTPGRKGKIENLNENGLDGKRLYVEVQNPNPVYSNVSTSAVVFTEGGPANSPYLFLSGDFPPGAGDAGVAFDSYWGASLDTPLYSRFTAEMFLIFNYSGGEPELAISFLGFEIAYEYVNSGSQNVKQYFFRYYSGNGYTALPIAFDSGGFTSWTHFAFVYNGSDFMIFQNGSLLAQFSVPLIQKRIWFRRIEGSVDSSDLPGGGISTSARLGLSSLRVVPRALYKENFTPPKFIRPM